MSARRTKKSLDPMADELYVTDGSNQTKPEGNPQASSVLNDFDSSQTEKQRTPSTNRRKLGSRRKPRQHVTDAETELHHKPRGEVEESTNGNKVLETTEPETRKELSQGREHDSSSFSTTATSYSCEVQNDSSNNQGNIPEILISINEKHPREKMSNFYGLVEFSQDVTDTIQSQEVKTLVDSSCLINADDQSLSMMEKDNSKSDEDDSISGQDELVKGNYLMSESYVESMDTAEETTAATHSDENQNQQDSQPQASFVSTGEQTGTSFNLMVSRGEPGSSPKNQLRRCVDESLIETKRIPDYKVDVEALETIKLQSETGLEELEKSDTDQTQLEPSTYAVGVSKSNSSNCHPTPSVREQQRIHLEDNSDTLQQWGVLQASDMLKSDEFNRDVEQEFSKQKDNGDPAESKRTVDLVIDSLRQEMSKDDEQDPDLSSSEFKAAMNSEDAVKLKNEGEIKHAEMKESSFTANSFQNEMHDTVVSCHQQDEHSAIESIVETLKHEGDHASDTKTERPVSDKHEETSTFEEQTELFTSAQHPEDGAKDDHEEKVKIAGIQEIHLASENVMGEATADLEQTSNQEKEKLLFDKTESKSPPETIESKTQENKVETSVLEEQNELFTSAQHSEDAATDEHEEFKPGKIQEILHSSEIVSHDARGNFETSSSNSAYLSKVNDSVTEQEVSNPDSQHSGCLATDSDMVALAHTHEDDHSDDTLYPQTSETDRDAESKERDDDTDLLTRWGIFQADNTVHGTHLNTGNTKCFNNPETIIENITHREHTETEYGVEREAVPSPGDEMSTIEVQVEHLSSAQVREARNSNDAAEDEHEEEVKHQTEHSSAKPMGSRRKLGSSRRHKGKRHVQDTSEPEEGTVENIWKLPVYGIVKMDVAESAEASICKDSQMISHHDCILPDDTSEIQNVEVSSRDTDRIHVQQKNSVSDSDTSLNVQQVDVEEEKKDPINEDEHEELFSLSRNEIETGTSLDVGHEESMSMEANYKVNVSEEVVRNLVGVEEVSLTEKKAQPSLRNNLNQEQEVNESSSEQPKQKSSTSELQTTKSKTLPHPEALGPEQSAPHVEEVLHSEPFVHGSDVRDGEGHDDVSVESTQQEEFQSNEIQINSVPSRGNGEVEHIPGAAQAALNDEQSAEGIKDPLKDLALKSMEVVSLVVVADQETVKPALPEQEMTEGAGNPKPEMTTLSPNLSSPNKRRKLSSTRKIRGSRFKVKDQRPVIGTDATNAEDVAPETVSGITTHDEQDSNAERRKEAVFETVNLSESWVEQREILDSGSQGTELEQDPDPDPIPANASPPDQRGMMSEPTATGRRKMGSNRKSAGRQKDGGQTAGEERVMDTQQEKDVRGQRTDPRVSNTPEDQTSKRNKVKTKQNEEHAVKHCEKEIIEPADESEKKSDVSNMSEHVRHLNEKASERLTPVPWTQAKVLLGQETSSESRSKHFNVLLIGDSYVGKTSFMKRAHSGKFSRDVPSSVCLDTCLWTVMLDGKPVVLQLWDTVGQERFHSITRQVFHKAQAFLLMYDVTSSKSFSAVTYWANCIQEGVTEDVIVLLLGNKNDHLDRQIKYEDGECLAREYNFEFMECSAATGDNVIYSLERVARMMSEKVDTQKEALVLHKAAPQKQRSGCC